MSNPTNDNDTNMYTEFKLNINNLNHEIIGILMRETNWYSLSELNVGYDTPIQFTIKIPNKKIYKESKNSNLENTNDLINKIDILTNNIDLYN